MLNLSFQTVFLAIAQIFAIGAVGFALVRKGIIDEQGLKLLSFLSINIVFPLFIFYQILHHFNPSHTPFWWGYPLVNISLTVVGLSATSLIFVLTRRLPKDEFLAAASLHNAGYIPLLFAMALPLGDMASKVYPAVIISIIGFDACLWSLGIWLMTRKKSGHMDLRKMINPPLVSMFLAIGIVLAGGQNFFPESFLKPVKIMGDSAMAIAMLVIGGNLAMTKLSNIQLQPMVGVVISKLVLLPMLALTAVLYLHLDPMISFILMLQSCMPTSISLSIIGRHYGTDNQDFINQSIFLTHILCIVTIPIFLGLFGKLGAF